MGEQAQHTPLPWRFERHQDFSQYFGNIVGSYGKDELGLESIRTITVQLRYGPPQEQEANAEFITRACNAHDDLVAALKASEREYENLDERAPTDSGCIECTLGTVPNHLNTGLCAHHLRKAALAKAESEK